MELNEELRDFIIKDPLGTLKMKLPTNACVFCEHCNELFYDYSHGPYLILCDLENHPDNSNGTCELFTERNNKDDN